MKLPFLLCLPLFLGLLALPSSAQSCSPCTPAQQIGPQYYDDQREMGGVLYECSEIVMLLICQQNPNEGTRSDTFICTAETESGYGYYSGQVVTCETVA